MKTLITIADKELKNLIFQHSAIEKLEKISQVDWVEEGKPYSSAELEHDISGYDACISGWGSPKITREVLANASNLKFVGHAAGTVIPYVDNSIFERDIIVVNANSALALSTAEAAVALIMAGAWNLHGFSTRLKQGLWMGSHESVAGLYKQVIGLIGYGDISKEVIRMLKPFEPRILLYSHYCPQSEADELGVELCSLEYLLKNSGIISLHNTLTSSTIGMIGKKELDMIKDGSLLVNTARGPIVDEKALVECLKTGRIYAALDVYDTEPLPNEHEFLQLQNALCLPHIGAYSNYWKSRLGLMVVEDLERWIKGEPLQGEITADKYKRLTPR